MAWVARLDVAAAIARLQGAVREGNGEAWLLAMADARKERPGLKASTSGVRGCLSGSAD